MTYELDPLTGDPLPKRKPQASQDAAINAMDSDTLATLDAMTKDALIALIKRVSGAMWGVGVLKKEDREEAMLLKLSILALTSTEARDVVSTSKEYFDRVKGKPMQSVDINQRIGIVAIVQEAARLRTTAPPLIDVAMQQSHDTTDK